MVSWTEHTYRVRSRKKTTQGKIRKRRLRNHGSTPSFPLHPEGTEKPKESKG